MNYQQKYLKYKLKYLQLKTLYGGADGDEETTQETKPENTTTTETKPEETKPEDPKPEDPKPEDPKPEPKPEETSNNQETTNTNNCEDLSRIYKPQYNFNDNLKYKERRNNLDKQIENYKECKLDELEKLAEKANNDLKKYYRLVHEIDRRDDECLDNVVAEQCATNTRCFWTQNKCISRCKLCNSKNCGNNRECKDCRYNFRKDKCFQKPIELIAKERDF